MTEWVKNLDLRPIRRRGSSHRRFFTVTRQLLIQILVSLILSASASSASALELSYAGRLSTTSGEPVAGAVAITFRFFREAAGGSALVTVNTPEVPLVDGIFQTTRQRRTQSRPQRH
jgi:hypothetical protein